MDEKINYIAEQIGGINKTLEFQSKQLEIHIKRTELLESRMVPIEDHVKFIAKLVRLAVTVASMTGAITLVIQLLSRK